MRPLEPLAPGPPRPPSRTGSGGALRRTAALVGVVVLLAGAGLYALTAPSREPVGTADAGTGDCTEAGWTVSDRLTPEESPPTSFPEDLPLAMSFSPDGSVLAVSQVDTVALWDWRESRALARIDHELPVVPPVPATFDPGGCLLAYGTPHGAVVVDLATGRSRTVGEERPVQAVAFAPDGSSLAVGVRSDPDGRLLHLYDTATWELRDRLYGSAALGSIRYSLDGDVIAGGEDGGGVAVWDVGDPVPRGLVMDRAGVGADAFDLVPDGSGVLIVRSGRVLLVDPETEEVVREYVPDTDGGVLVDVAYSAASGRVFAARLDPVTRAGDMVAWEFDAATEVALGPDLPRVFPMTLSGDGSRVAGLRTGRGDIAVYDTELSLLDVVAR